MAIAVIKGNKREIPGELPPLEWWERVTWYYERNDFSSLYWHDPVLEYLTPDEVRRIRAKAMAWIEVTRETPCDIATWWEVRKARRRGDAPHTAERAIATIDDDEVLHCGHCGARWSDRPERCSLCDRVINVAADEPSTALA